MKNKNIRKGVYIVIDPAMDKNLLMRRIGQLINEDLAAIQIWDNFENTTSISETVADIIYMYKDSRVPILINNRWELLKEFDLDGVHFDTIPQDWEDVNNKVGRNFIKGVTLTNDLEIAKKAEALKFDYLSFCSLFPSETSTSCELVEINTIQKCKELTTLPIFLSGGITTQNMQKLQSIDFDGVAVVSGIMNEDDTLNTWKEYNNTLFQITQRDKNET